MMDQCKFLNDLFNFVSISNIKLLVINLRNIEKYLKNKNFQIRSSLVREFLAEILGTMIMVTFGLSTGAQYTFFKRDDPNNIDFLSINFGAGFGVTIAVLIVGKASGAHLSPAISFSMFLLGRMTLIRFLVYCLAQTIGAFLAALLVFVLYFDMLQTYGDAMYSLDTAGIFATYPNKNLSSFGGFFDQTVGTAILGFLFLFYLYYAQVFF